MKSYHTEKKSEFIADLDVKVGNEEDLDNDKNDSKFRIKYWSDFIWWFIILFLYINLFIKIYWI